MATLHFTNGTTKQIEDSKAKTIEAILNGTRQPEDSLQAAYCEKVANVTFEPEEELEQPLGKGYAHFKKVGEELKKHRASLTKPERDII